MKRTRYPTKCPNCGETDFDSAVDSDHDEELREDCTCLDCGFQWTNLFEFQLWDETD